MPQFDAEALVGREAYYLLTSLVAPRPIAWVSTVSPEGVANLAPHSYFNVISSEPPIVHFTSQGEKDTLRNVRTGGEFVVNVVSRDLLEPMNLTSADFPPGEDEFAWAGMEKVPSRRVRPPRVAATPAALECRVRAIISMGNGNMIFGDVLHIHVADAVWRDGRVDPLLVRALGRLGGADYVEVDEVVSLPRPRWDDLRESAG